MARARPCQVSGRVERPRGSRKTFTLRSHRVTRWWRRDCRDRPSPAACAWSTHPITLDCVAWLPTRLALDLCEALRARSSTSSTISSTASRLGARQPGRPRHRLRIPAPFHRDLRAARRPRRRAPRPWGWAHRASGTHVDAPRSTPRPSRRRIAVVAQLTSLVQLKAEDPGDDVITRWTTARDSDERLNQQELLSTIFQLIVAGHDTTASLIENSVVALLLHPDQLAELRAVPTTISAAVEELLRYDAPVPHATFPGTPENRSTWATRPSRRRQASSTSPRPATTRSGIEPDTLNAPVLTPGTSRSGTASTSVSASRSPAGGPTGAHLAAAAVPGAASHDRARRLHWGHGDGLVLFVASASFPSSPDPPTHGARRRIRHARRGTCAAGAGRLANGSDRGTGTREIDSCTPHTIRALGAKIGECQRAG